MRVSINWKITEPVSKAHYDKNDDLNSVDDIHVPVPEDVFEQKLEDYEENDVLGIFYNEKLIMIQPLKNNNVKSVFEAMHVGMNEFLNNNDSFIRENVYTEISQFFNSNHRLNLINKFENRELSYNDLTVERVWFYGVLLKKGNMWEMVIA